jgi:rod shape-determining protein MreC
MMGTSGWSMHAPSMLTRLLVFVALSVALMIADHRGQHLERIRQGLSVLLSPIQYAAALPGELGGWTSGFFGGDRGLRERYERLNAELPLLQARLQKYEALAAENEHLRRLLGSAARVAERAVVAELVEVSREPFTRQITVAKGRQDGLFVGQPVLDAHGIMGQVAEVGVLNSRATLITDPGHAIPVQVNRNGLRAIAFGVGHPDRVEVRHLTSSADIREGDLLISSGIGSTFPFGYPVAEVTKIVNDPNEAFLEVSARPVAQLGHNKEVLLIWPAEPAEPTAAAPRR